MLYKLFLPTTLLCVAALAQAPGDPSAQTPTTPQTNPNTTNPYPTSTPNPNAIGSQSTNASMPSDPIVTEKTFIKRAADKNATEVELGKLAQEKGSSDTVKQFGKQIVDDGERTRQSLVPAANRLKVEVPSEVSKGGRKTVDKLAKLSGPEFDHAFAKAMANARKDDIASYTQVAQTSSTPEVKDFAVHILPSLEQQRKTAEELAANTKTK